MPAPKNNNYNLKLKTAELRQQAYKQYCEHLASGMSKKSWYFQHPNLMITWQTMENYILKYEDLDPIHKEIAQAKGLHYWEGIVADSATGKNKDANTASLQMIMRNKFGWDKTQSLEKGSTRPLIKAMAKGWRKM